MGQEYLDFDIDEFLCVSKVIDFPTGKGKSQKLTVRTLSDLEMQAKQEYITAARTRTAQALQDKDSEEYAKKIAPLQFASRDDLISRLLESRKSDCIREARELYPVDFIPQPEDATEEEIVKNRVTQKMHEDSVYESRSKYVSDALVSHLKKLEGLSDADLLKNAVANSVWLFSAVAGIDADQRYLIHRAFETSTGKPKWKTPNEVQKLPEKAINRLLAEYQSVDQIDPWKLTKSISERTTIELGANSADSAADPASEQVAVAVDV